MGETSRTRGIRETGYSSAQMKGGIILENSAIRQSDGRVRTGMTVLLDEGKILRVSLADQIPTLPGDWEVSCRGRLVWPGRCDCHAHLMAGPLGGSGVEGREVGARRPGAGGPRIGGVALGAAFGGGRAARAGRL